MTNLTLFTAAPLVLALTLFGGTAISRTLIPAAPDTGSSAAQEGGKHGEHDEHGEHGEDEHGVLHESMELMQRSLKGLRKMLKKPEMKAEAIALCVTMEGAALEGFLHPPESPDGLEGTELLIYQSEFKKQMLTVAATLVDLELALDKGDADQTKALYRALGANKKEGHDVYIK